MASPAMASNGAPDKPRSVHAKVSPPEDGGDISSGASVEYVSNHPLGIRTDNSWSLYDPSAIPSGLLFEPPTGKGSKGKGAKGKGDLLQENDPWTTEGDKGNKGVGKGPPVDRLLEVDPTFLLFLIKHFNITIVFVNDEITDWSASLVNLTPRDEPLYYVAHPVKSSRGRCSVASRSLETNSWNAQPMQMAGEKFGW
ncbi:unnamed protein product [Polarella glacialis]|uniref:Uncharacterized protein n=1 Tax=Polarella glacialis TaxID=89957 RepID=A0A813GCS7_POLGL|nr:unnamed protein product [Polarella glacialis]CAE8728961.1 unnamed protein product [Polarella glacialis]